MAINQRGKRRLKQGSFKTGSPVRDKHVVGISDRTSPSKAREAGRRVAEEQAKSKKNIEVRLVAAPQDRSGPAARGLLQGLREGHAAYGSGYPSPKRRSTSTTKGTAQGKKRGTKKKKNKRS